MWPVMKKRRSSGTVVILIGGVADQVVKAEDSSDCHFSDAVEKRPKVAALFFVGFLQMRAMNLTTWTTRMVKTWYF